MLLKSLLGYKDKSGNPTRDLTYSTLTFYVPYVIFVIRFLSVTIEVDV